VSHIDNFNDAKDQVQPYTYERVNSTQQESAGQNLENDHTKPPLFLKFDANDASEKQPFSLFNRSSYFFASVPRGFSGKRLRNYFLRCDRSKSSFIFIAIYR
jgi:hypothetical protein